MQNMSISEDSFSRSLTIRDRLIIPYIKLDASGEDYFASAIA